MRQPSLRHGKGIGARRERGVVLLIALIVLVAMTLAGLGMMRSIDTGTIVAGNIGFREAAVATGDTGIERARTWLMANTASLNIDQPTAGYYSTRQDSLDITGNRTEGGTDGVDWGGSDPSQPVKAVSLGAVDSSGNTVFYIIHRLCSVPGSVNAANQSCATVAVAGTGSTQDAPTYSAYALAIQNLAYFRVTARVNGPKNTVSYVQAVLLM
jgi:Tfp pilus assembly protein PilX